MKFNNIRNANQAQIQRYQSRLSGPLLDRIDMHLEVPSVNIGDLTKSPEGESSALIRSRVAAAHIIQKKRYRDRPLCHFNSQMSNADLNEHCKLDKHGQAILETAAAKLGLSARAFHRILKISRTIADLAQSQDIETAHLAEAVQYRRTPKI